MTGAGPRVTSLSISSCTACVATPRPASARGRSIRSASRTCSVPTYSWFNRRASRRARDRRVCAGSVSGNVMGDLPCERRSSRDREDLPERRAERLPLIPAAPELATAPGRQAVDAPPRPATALLLLLPRRGYLAGGFEPIQRGIERSLLELEQPAPAQLQPAEDLQPVRLA